MRPRPTPSLCCAVCGCVCRCSPLITSRSASTPTVGASRSRWCALWTPTSARAGCLCSWCTTPSSHATAITASHTLWWVQSHTGCSQVVSCHFAVTHAIHVVMWCAVDARPCTPHHPLYCRCRRTNTTCAYQAQMRLAAWQLQAVACMRRQIWKSCVATPPWTCLSRQWAAAVSTHTFSVTAGSRRVRRYLTFSLQWKQRACWIASSSSAQPVRSCCMTSIPSCAVRPIMAAWCPLASTPTGGRRARHAVTLLVMASSTWPFLNGLRLRFYACTLTERQGGVKRASLF